MIAAERNLRLYGETGRHVHVLMHDALQVLDGAVMRKQVGKRR